MGCFSEKSIDAPRSFISPTFLIPSIVACALFMEKVNETVIVTALPNIAHDLGEDPIALKLALTSYFVSLACFIPISGWMADKFGARNIFRAAIGVFISGSILCGLANSLAYFVAARFLQGIGGAMMMPVGRLIISRSVPKSGWVQALSYLTIPALVGPVIGPPLGGLITTYLNWHWIFFINVPVSLLGIVLATRYFRRLEKQDTAPLDLIGALLLAPGLSALMFGAATTGRHLVSLHLSCAIFAMGIVLAWLYFKHAQRTVYPLLDFSLFRMQTFRAGVLGGFLFRIGLGALPFLLPLLFQIGFGISPLHSGLLTCAGAVGALLMKFIAPRILRQFGFRVVLTVNIVLVSVSIAAIASFTKHTPYAVILTVLLAGGCFRSLQFTSLNALTYADIQTGKTSAATSLESVTRELASGTGVTVGAFILQMSSVIQGHHNLVMQDFWPAFIAVGLITLASIGYSIRLPVDARDEIAGR